MVAKEITSLQHSLVKKCVLLRKDRFYREEESRVFISGQKLIQDLSSFWPIEILFYTDHSPEIPAMETIRVALPILKKITGLDEPDGVAAIVPMPKEQSLKEKTHILILDQVSDPGNLGTLWRTALAFNWDGIWITPGTADPFNDKALRAAQGATFRLPFEKIFPEDVIHWAHARKACICTADLHGIELNRYEKQLPFAFILGNEGKGPGNWTKEFSSVTIPIQNVESLNVASAGAIFLNQLRP